MTGNKKGIFLVITAKTLCFPMVGSPVSQTYTPAIINSWFQNKGLDAVMIGADIQPAAIENYFEGLRCWNNCGGCSVTIPYKQVAFRAVDDATERAIRLGVVNTIRRMSDGKLIGEMTDGLAMISALAKKDIYPAGKTALLVGAGGGAGTAIADALCEAGIEKLILLETDKPRLSSLITMLSNQYPAVKLYTETVQANNVDIAINASPLGTNKGDSMPFDFSCIKPNGMVADVITKPEMTGMLAEARKLGFAILTGVEMAGAQLPLQMHHWGIRS
ncbi:MAG: shikimate dehydrogenase [Devosiaceae bacterium]|nr:shikimate dehydrogenase [Devosiaceae bacterium]